MTDHLDLIAKILRKAEGTDNQHEKDAFFTRAQTLATRHSIDLAVARSHTAKAEQREQIEERTIVIGARGTKGLSRFVALYTGIGRANDLQFLIAADSTRVYAQGFPSDIDVTTALYASLVGQMVQAAEAYLKTGTYREEQVWSDTKWAWVPLDGRVARGNFYDGFTRCIQTRLLEAKLAAEATVETEAEVAEGTGSGLSSMALVLREKKAEVLEWHQRNLKERRIRGSYRGGSSTTRSIGARAAGDRAGRSASLTSSRSIGA